MEVPTWYISWWLGSAGTQLWKGGAGSSTNCGNNDLRSGGIILILFCDVQWDVFGYPADNDGSGTFFSLECVRLQTSQKKSPRQYMSVACIHNSFGAGGGL